MNGMKTILILLLTTIYSQTNWAKSNLNKTVCLIPIESSKENSIINERLKVHQKLKSISFSIDLRNLQSDTNKNLNLIFETTQSKKFETIYSHYNKSVNVWKVDFSKSVIFPQLFKNYMNISFFNNKYYLRLYDNPTEKSIVNLTFDSSSCSMGKLNLLTRVGTPL